MNRRGEPDTLICVLNGLSFPFSAEDVPESLNTTIIRASGE